MTIVRSLGVTTLVALLSAHRASAEHGETTNIPYDQRAVAMIEAYLNGRDEPPDIERTQAPR